MNTNNVHIALNDLSGSPSQRWVMRKTSIDARNTKSRNSPGKAESSFGWQRGFFEIRASNGRVVTVSSGGRVYLRSRTEGTDQQFFFNARTKTVTSRRYRQLSLASKSVGGDRFKLLARRTQRTSPAFQQTRKQRYHPNGCQQKLRMESQRIKRYYCESKRKIQQKCHLFHHRH